MRFDNNESVHMNLQNMVHGIGFFSSLVEKGATSLHTPKYKLQPKQETILQLELIL